MAHPADMAPKAPAAFASGRLSPEEAERLASTFRPSWELDDAPFTGPGTMSEADMRALQGGGTHSDVRAVAQSSSHASNGAHAPPAPTQSHEPENSVIIDRSITADAAPPAAPKAVAAAKPAGTTILGMAAPPMPAPQAAPQAVPQPVFEAPPQAPPARPQPITRRPPAPAFHVPAPGRAKPVSIDLEDYPKKSKTGLWVGLGVGGMAVIGLVSWLALSSGSSPRAALPEPPPKATDDKVSSVPPPPPPTTAAAAATTTSEPVTPPPPATTAAAVTPIPTTPVTALPQAAPLPRAAAAFQPRPSYGGGAPAARPAGKPKGGQTIVRDVPF